MKQKEVSGAAAPAQILIVDDEAIILQVFGTILEEAGYHIDAAEDANAAREMLTAKSYDVVISDIIMPGLSGMELLKMQKQTSPDVPFVLVTGNPNLDSASEAIRIGSAIDYLIKPVSGPELIKTVARAVEIKRVRDENRRLEAENQRYQHHLEDLVRKKSAELVQAYNECRTSYSFTLEALVALLDARERSTGEHSKRVREFALIIAHEMNLSAAEIEDISQGILLHDIGKIAIPDSILLKPGELTEEEWVIMKSHAQIGHDILQSSERLAGAAEIIRSHHEKFDGSGYPRGLKGEEICLGARIFAIVDAYDAMRSVRVYKDSVRVYKDSVSEELALEEMLRCNGAHFDPAIVDVFLECRPALEEIAQWDTLDPNLS